MVLKLNYNKLRFKVFEKIYLDPNYMESFHRIALKEKYAKMDGEFVSINQKYVDLMEVSQRNNLRKRTLQYLTLFEEVDGVASPLNLEKLVDCGILDSGSHMITGMKSIQESDLIRDTSSKIVIKVLDENKDDIIKIYSSRLKALGETIDSNIDLDLFYERCRKRIIEEMSFDGARDLTIEPHGLYEELSRKSFGLHDVLCSSLNEGVQIVSPYVSQTRKHRKNFEEQFEELNCLAQVNLKNEINILPNPKNLKDVMRMREKRELATFRGVVSEWMEVLEDGNVSAEEKVRKDIKKANAALRCLEGWEEYKNSDFAFWVNTIGGHVPIFSNVLTLVTTVGDKAYTHAIRKKYGWALMLR
ncbi:hypothetical protein DR996_17125 [Vibrio owensii]|nr:hypothetical protein DR996_17125 [Vibrio owensii]